MVVVAALGAGLGVAARPDADIDGVDRLPLGQRVARQATMGDGRIEAAPAAAMDGGQAQMGGREGRPRRQEGVQDLEEGVGALVEAGVCVGTAVAQGSESGCGVHRLSLPHWVPLVELKYKLKYDTYDIEAHGRQRTRQPPGLCPGRSRVHRWHSGTGLEPCPTGSTCCSGLAVACPLRAGTWRDRLIRTSRQRTPEWRSCMSTRRVRHDRPRGAA